MTYSGFISGESATNLGGTLAYSGTATTAVYVGTNYVITPSGLTSTNYDISFVAGKLDITKKALTITAADKTKVYDGAVFSPFTVTYSGFITGESATNLGGTLAYSGTATTAVNVGTNYVITPGGLTSTNYYISFVAGKLDITKKALTIAAEDKTKCYDGAVFSPFTVTYSGFITGESATNLGGTLTFSGTAATAINAGSYIITPGGLTSGNYAISFINGTLTVNSLPVPTITGTSAVCEGTTFLSYTTEAAMTGYSWSISAGGTITAGALTNAVVVNWNTTGARTLSVNYVNANGCTATNAVVKNVTVNPVPGNAGSITGMTDICAGVQGVDYSIPVIPNALTYKWSIPPGATIASGDGTPGIKVNYGANASSGNVSVYGYNLCEYGKGTTLAVKVNPLPEAAGSITGQSTFAQGTRGSGYSVNPIANATSYTWTLPTGATIVSGANTNAITVDFSMNAVSGNISVYGSNSCVSGAVSPAFAVALPVNLPVPEYGVYPVPNNGHFTVSIKSPVETTFTISIIDHLGQKVMDINNAETVNGIYMKVIDLPPLPSGYYYVEFLSSQFKETRKMFVKR